MNELDFQFRMITSEHQRKDTFQPPFIINEVDQVVSFVLPA